jgi:hypothetical protein
VNDSVNRSDALIDRGPLLVSEFAASEGSDVLKRNQQVAPSVCEGRGKRIATQDPAERLQATAIAPTLDKRLKRVEQVGVVVQGPSAKRSIVSQRRGKMMPFLAAPVLVLILIPRSLEPRAPSCGRSERSSKAKL